MKGKQFILLAVVAIVFAAFFMPWVSVKSDVTGTVGSLAEKLTGKKMPTVNEVNTSISGYQVPVMANSESSKLAITLIKIFAPDIKDADKKSYLIWAIPLLPVLMFLLTNAVKSKWVFLVHALIGIGVFGGATFKILTTDLDKMIMKVEIGNGLWIVLVGYLIFGLIEGLSFLTAKK